MRVAKFSRPSVKKTVIRLAVSIGSCLFKRKEAMRWIQPQSASNLKQAQKQSRSYSVVADAPAQCLQNHTTAHATIEPTSVLFSYSVWAQRSYSRKEKKTLLLGQRWYPASHLSQQWQEILVPTPHTEHTNHPLCNPPRLHLHLFPFHKRAVTSAEREARFHNCNRRFRLDLAHGIPFLPHAFTPANIFPS